MQIIEFDFPSLIFLYDSTTLFTLLINQHAGEPDRYWTPLHFAAINRKKEIVEILIAKIIGDKNPQNRKGFPETGTVTPESLAERNGHYDIVKMIKNLIGDKRLNLTMTKREFMMFLVGICTGAWRS